MRRFECFFITLSYGFTCDGYEIVRHRHDTIEDMLDEHMLVTNPKRALGIKKEVLIFPKTEAEPSLDVVRSLLFLHLNFSSTPH